MSYLAEAYAALHRGDLDEAYLLCQHAATAEPASAEAYALWGKVCQTRLNYQEALKHYQKAAELEPEKATYRYQIANAFMLQGQYEQAEAFYRQVLGSEINDPWLFCNLGKALLYQNRLEAAADFLQKAVEVAPRLAEAHCCLGCVFTKQKRFEAADLQYQKAIELEPGQFIYYHDCGDNLLLQGNYRAAVVAYRKAAELNSSYVWTYRNLGRALLQLEAWNDAAIALQEAIRLGSTTETYADLGYAFSKQQKWQEAIATYQAAVKHCPNDALYRELGVVQERIGDVSGTIGSFRKAIELNPQQPVWVYETLLELVYQQGNLAEAIAVGQRGIEQYPQQTSLQQWLKNLQEESQIKIAQNLQSAQKAASYTGDKLSTQPIKQALESLSTTEPSKIFIVTPAYNAVNSIDRTIASVVLQAGDFVIHYHVQDGGSEDGTVELLERWAERIKTGAIPLLCKQVHFTYVSARDEGVYDALYKGFNKLKLQPNDWMTWLNAGAILMPGACAFMAALDKQLDQKTVRWVTGTAFVANENVPVVNTEIPVNQEVIRSGLCDGQHWEHVQQEGTFFRNSLWGSVDTDNGFRKYKFAGDWNLWRLFAEKKANIFQASFSLAQSSSKREKLQNQASDYYLEIDSTVSKKLRSQNLERISSASLKRYLIRSNVHGEISLKKESFDPYKEFLLKGKFKSDAKSKLITQSQYSKLLDANLAGKRVAHNNTVIGFDSDWQYPAITEKQAFLKACEILPRTQNTIYLAFPWATLIDQLNTGVATGNELKAILNSFREELKNYQYVVTVCQHILMLKYQQLFIDLGVTHIYWSHATKEQSFLPQDGQIQILPFPLFPVQASEGKDAKIIQRKYLYSFIGARANKWYLTNARDLIIDHLSSDSRGLVVGRDNWHFQKVVYDCQIFHKEKPKQELINTQATEEFKTVLAESLFSLCPSGTGPNSIRLWESIGYGAIPVILADTYLPPGDRSLWEAAAVFCGENLEEILALPNRLAEMAKDEQLIQTKQAALKQLWMLYGPDCFIYDIVDLFLKLQQKQMLKAAR